MTMSPHEQPAAPGTDLVHWAEEANEVYKIANILSNTAIVPRSIQGRPDEIAAQIMYGRELNIPPLLALNQIHMIEGRPSLSALAMRALAQSKGVKFRLEETTETRCKYSAMAPGDAGWTTVTWTMDRAKKLGLDGKANWKKQPMAMLIARATSELCRLVAAPIFLGMQYSLEELRDGVDDIAQLSEQSAPAVPQPETRTMRRDPIKATATVPRQEQPALGYSTQDDPRKQPEATPTDVQGGDGVTPNTRKALMATFNDAGIKERTERLGYVSDLLKREVHSVNQITEVEAKAVLQQLRIDYPQTAGQADEWDDAKPAEVPQP